MKIAHVSLVVAVVLLCSLTRAAGTRTLRCVGTLISNQGSETVPYQVKVKIWANSASPLNEDSRIAVADAGNPQRLNLSSTNRYVCQIEYCPPSNDAHCTCAEPAPKKFPELSLAGELVGDGPFRGRFELTTYVYGGTSLVGQLSTKLEQYHLVCGK